MSLILLRPQGVEVRLPYHSDLLVLDLFLKILHIYLRWGGAQRGRENHKQTLC